MSTPAEIDPLAPGEPAPVTRGQFSPGVDIARDSADVEEAAVGPQGGTAWNSGKTIGIRVAPGGAGQVTTVTFAAVRQETTDESPLSQLAKVLAGPVDIVPSSPLTSADVVFKFDPTTIPADAAAPGNPLPTIKNAGIETYSDALGMWMPIPTAINEQAQELSAKVPHFSLFRMVINKIGEFTIDVGRKIKVVLTDVMTSIERLIAVGTALLKSWAQDFIGEFDESKYRCEPKSADFRVTIKDSTGLGKLAACVVRQPDGNNQLVLKNGLAVPMAFEAPGVPFVSPQVGTADTDQLEPLTIVRDLAGIMGGTSIVSGLSLGYMQIGPKAPEQFTVRGRLSWEAAVVDIAAGFLKLLCGKYCELGKGAVVLYRETLAGVKQVLADRIAKGEPAVSAEELTALVRSTAKAQTSGSV